MPHSSVSFASTIPPRRPLQGLWHGAAFYPELWPNLDLDEELERIKGAGLSVVRIGEFAWSKMEPTPNAIDLQYFVGVLDRIEAAGLKAIFGTPTATPPIWLTHGHPERCLQDVEGRVMVHGGRQHLAIDEPYVRERCAMIVEAVARSVGRHPALLAWQIDNEFKCDVDADYGPSVKPVWEQWLEERYGCIEQLNTLWGTGVWSQEYQSFSQVPFPVKCPGLHNASLQTAWKRFSRERVADFCREQAAIIRKHSKMPITHNAGMLFQSNPVLIVKELDFVSFDHYVDHSNYREMVVNYDFWRNLHPSRRFWVMETSSGHNGSLLGFHKPHPPGFVRAEAVAAFALGASGFCYWVWRQQRAGAELTHGCLMQSWDSPAMGMQAAKEVERAREALEPLLEGKELIRAEVGLVWSDTGRIMLQVEPHNGLDYPRLMMDWASSIRALGLHLDVLPEGQIENSHKVILTPFLPALSKELTDRLVAFVKAGGIWIAGPLTGGRTIEHTVPLDAGLGALERIAGIRTVHSYPLQESGAVAEIFGETVSFEGWGYLFESRGSVIKGVLEGGPTPGLGVLSEFELGAGRIVVLGAQPIAADSDRLVRALVRHYAREAEVSQWYTVTEGTLVAPWGNSEESLLIAVNLDGKGGSVVLPEGTVSCDDDMQRSVAGTVMLDPYAHRVFRMPDAFSPQS